jgi:hypothetical protein
MRHTVQRCDEQRARTREVEADIALTVEHLPVVQTDPRLLEELGRLA